MNQETEKCASIGVLIKNNMKELAAAVLFFLTYTPTFIWMWDRWFASDSYYSHGILVPLVSAYLIWLTREDLAKVTPQRSAWGVPITVIGITLHLLSSLFRIYFTSAFSMFIVLIGLILYFYGIKILRKIAFPVFFLLFMIPVPLILIKNVSFKMKMLAAEIATGMLNNIGLPALRAGSMIRMNHATVIVDDVCSGLRSLISLAALGSIFAYWMKGPMVKRIALFLTTIPIAVITNVVRVIFLATIAEVWGPEAATGFTHDVSGFLVFGLAFLLLFAMGKLLE